MLPPNLLRFKFKSEKGKAWVNWVTVRLDRREGRGEGRFGIVDRPAGGRGNLGELNWYFWRHE